MTHTADFHVVATTQVQAEKTFRPLNALGQWLRHALDELLAEQPKDPTASFGPRDWADMPVHHPEEE